MDNKNTIIIDGFEVNVNDPYLKDRVALAQRFNECQNTIVETPEGNFTVSTIQMLDNKKMYHTVITAPDTTVHTIEYYLSMSHAEKAHQYHIAQVKENGNKWDKYEHYEKPK